MTVRYHPDADQRALVASFDRPLDALLPTARLHASVKDGAETWAGLAALGLFGIASGETAGGVGLGAAEEVLLTEHLGRHLAAPSVFAAMAAAHADAPAEVASIVSGAERVAPAYHADSDEIVLVDGDGVDLVLLRAENGAALYRLAASGTLEAAAEQLWATTLHRGAELGECIAKLDEAASRRARLIDAAALAGIAGAALDMAVAYAGMREQFGRPIGSFQAVKHQCADMAIAARAAVDQVTFAAIAVDDAREDAASQVEAALLLGIEAALGNARRNIQVHGGIGFSEEADPHLLLKRAHVYVAIAGGGEGAAARVASAKRAL